MVDGQGQDPAKRVVKRVVKKTVVRPASSGTSAPTTPKPSTSKPSTSKPSTSPAAAPQPVIRYGRPVATATKQSAARPAAKATSSTARTRPSAPTIKRQPPSVDVGAKVAAVRDVSGRALRTVAHTTGDAGRATGRVAVARARAIAAWRLPHLNAYLASVITGVVVGLVAVLLGAAALSLFSAVRGVSSGGGLWGGLAFAAVAIVSVLVGEALLRGFGTRSARLTSVLAVVLTIVAMLGLFLDVVDGAAGFVLVPLIGAAGYALAHWLLELAENAPTIVE